MKHRLLWHLVAPLLLAPAVLAGPSRAACDAPLVVSHSGGTARVLIVLDTSGSMNDAVESDSYDRGVTYTGSFNSSRSYDVSNDGTYSPRSFNSNWASSPTAYLVNSDQGESGSYSGNYLNWVYFHATATQRGAIPALTRIQAAKQAVSTVLAGGTGVQYGLMVFNGDAGGRLLASIGTAPTDIQALLPGLRANSYTPLAETMVTALDYFQSTGAGAAVTASCEKLFTVLVTDGLPTKDLNIPDYLKDYDQDGQDPGNCTSLGTGYANSMDCSGYLDDVTTYLFQNDLRPDLPGFQNAPTYVIAVDIDAPLLRAAAEKGGGEYFTVDNPAGLNSALASAFDLIAAQMGASASVSVVSAEDRTQNRLYRARFESQTWRGFIESFALPYRPGAAPLWEAGQLLQSRSASSRTVFTSTTGTNKADFTTANAATLQSLLGAVDATEAASLIDYVRGGAVAGTRDRDGWKLGDVVDAAPLMVGKPAGWRPNLDYSAFRAANASRDEVLYVAANDGMLHCFDGATGNERWAYVPRSVLPRLRRLADPAYCHEYFLNMTPVAYDVKIAGVWKTMLVGGLERGGSGLFALDVTDPDAADMSVMWDRDISGLKGSWNPPTLVHSRAHNGHVLAVGTGLDAATASSGLLVLDPASGSTLATFAFGTAVAGNKMTRATAIDLDFDGWDDRLYVGDLAGRLWRVDVSTNPWTVTLLFDCGQPISAQPVLTLDALGRVMVFFGTGRYLTDSDLSSTAQQAFYAIVDDGSGTAVSLANLVDQTNTINAVPGGKRGWYVNLVQAAGERINRKPALIAGTVYVPSFRPNDAACLGGGDAWLYSFDFKDGSAPSNANGSENNTVAGRVEQKAGGILADPTLDLVNETLVLQSSNASLVTKGLSISLKKLVVRSWRQRFN